MIKALDIENAYSLYPITDQIVGVKKQDSTDMSKNELISTASLELVRDLKSSLKYDCNSGEQKK